MSAEILKATAVDVVELNKLVNSAYRGDSSRQGWTTEADMLDGTRIDEDILKEIIQRPDTTVLLYKDGPRLLGCVELRTDEMKIYLGMLSVMPNTQGKGIGKRLLKEAEVYALEQGCNKIYMTVISVRTELIDWYVRHGYHLTDERKPFKMPDVRFGIPKQELEFVVLEKIILPLSL